MSANSLRNVLPQRTHRERSQPAQRARKYGLLEKHADYKQRAVDYHKKQDTINRLQLKAALKNPDEYYTGMHNAQTVNGKHAVRRTGAKYTEVQRKLMKIQDINYLTYQLQHNTHKIDKLNSHLQQLNEQQRNSTKDEVDEQHTDRPAAATAHHTVFVENKDEQAVFDPVQYFGTPAELLSRTYNRPHTSQISSDASIVLNKPSTVSYQTIKQLNTQRLHEYRNISKRLQHNNKINGELQYLVLQKNLMSKGRREKIVTTDKFGDVDEKKTVFKWKLQRKK